MPSLSRRFTLSDLRAARSARTSVAMLTCYDFSNARLMQEAGVPMLLVGDSAANVILGYDSTVPIPLDFLIELTAAVRRGAPLALVIADMPFGSYGGELQHAFDNVVRMVKQSGADCVKIEAGEAHLPLIRQLSGNGIAVMAHLGLRPQTVNLVGGYKVAGKTAADAEDLLDLASQMEHAGAAALLLEATTVEAAERVVERVGVPVIGCGAGPACCAHVVVTHDIMGISPKRPKFAPLIGDAATPLKRIYSDYVDQITSGAYPAVEHTYEMSPEERAKLLAEK